MASVRCVLIGREKCACQEVRSNSQSEAEVGKEVNKWGN